ncbi:hypothetical protein RFI_30883 [Reticulomyxa filosa]|uniref:Viral A-type inclusion protein n=1 Tax=Reticulomyxa filosa TaxID=46433 RepID=X6LZD6_RETFI|nr:hypothetical protein RFI_30883 [Reticulomyxa filosa]|eukprot:ETO06507.1 hypothetical protein RFI_30883 [Reticulomyxa filosa]
MAPNADQDLFLQMMLQDKLRIIEEKYRKGKQELIACQQRCHSLESQLSSYQYKGEAIRQNYNKIEQYQMEIDTLTKQVKYLQDKYDLLSQTKNVLSHDLSEQQQKAETLQTELEGKEDRLKDMSEQLAMYKAMEQKLSELEHSNTKVTEEYNRMKEQYLLLKDTCQKQGQELKVLAMQKQEVEMENLLLKDNNDKLTATNQDFTQRIQDMLKDMGLFIYNSIYINAHINI